jgi:salicylate 5-hydroxylase small subunit
MDIDFKTYFEVLNLYSDYASVCDSNEWERWEDFFVEESTYRLQPRENFEQGLPLCLIDLQSKAMIKDRVFSVKETMYFDPYYQRHIVGVPRIVSLQGDMIISGANYTVIRTKYDGDSTVLSVGYYHDEIIKTNAGLKFKSRLCVYDSEMIANSILYPI